MLKDRAIILPYQVSITVNKHQHKRVALLYLISHVIRGLMRRPSSYLTTSLSLVFLTAFFHFLIVTFEGAVVLQETPELVQYFLQGLMMFLIFPSQASQVMVQGVYISVPQHLDGVSGKAYACPKRLIRIASGVNIQRSSEKSRRGQNRGTTAPRAALAVAAGKNKFVAGRRSAHCFVVCRQMIVSFGVLLSVISLLFLSFHVSLSACRDPVIARISFHWLWTDYRRTVVSVRSRESGEHPQIYKFTNNTQKRLG